MKDNPAMMYRRSQKHLAVIWLIALITIGAIRFIDVKAPAFHELLLPFYWVTILVTLVFTWRWLRSRSRKERRGKDRRSTDRRDE
jgi:hypothetical protein